MNRSTENMEARKAEKHITKLPNRDDKVDETNHQINSGSSAEHEQNEHNMDEQTGARKQRQRAGDENRNGRRNEDEKREPSNGVTDMARLSDEASRLRIFRALMSAYRQTQTTAGIQTPSSFEIQVAKRLQAQLNLRGESIDRPRARSATPTPVPEQQTARPQKRQRQEVATQTSSAQKHIRASTATQIPSREMADEERIQRQRQIDAQRQQQRNRIANLPAFTRARLMLADSAASLAATYCSAGLSTERIDTYFIGWLQQLCSRGVTPAWVIRHATEDARKLKAVATAAMNQPAAPNAETKTKATGYKAGRSTQHDYPQNDGPKTDRAVAAGARAVHTTSTAIPRSTQRTLRDTIIALGRRNSMDVHIKTPPQTRTQDQAGRTHQ